MAFVTEIMGGGTGAGQASAIGGTGGTLAGTGTIQGDAALVKASVTILTAADGTVGVRLPAVSAGSSCVLFNNAAATMKVWPPVGAAITVNGTGLGTANAAFSHLTYKTVTYTWQSATQIFANVSA